MAKGSVMDGIARAEVVADDELGLEPGDVARHAGEPAVSIPDYLRETYSWAYLNPRSIGWLDNPVVVEGILWGNFSRLVRSALAEFEPGSNVLQPACVYGDLSPKLAERLGPEGRLVVTDVAPVQIANCKPKIAAHPNATTRLLDAADHPAASVDAVCCFFLLHEIPEAHRRLVTASLLDAVRPGGRAVFVDYHRPSPWHPLRPLMSLVFDTLEPYAKDLWRADIQSFGGAAAARFTWRKELFFGGLYQKVVAVAA